MSHDYHGGLGCPEGTILYDGCEECEERSKRGITGFLELDLDRVEALWRRMIVTEKGVRPDVLDLPGYPVQDGYLTTAESRIGVTFYHLAILLERAGDPSAWWPGKFYKGEA